jgi:multidrug efflux pump subunit AcrA (membrane-fusion protein)
MKPRPPIASSILVVVAFAGLVWMATAAAQSDTPRSKSATAARSKAATGVIVVPGCKVDFVDDRLIASGRSGRVKAVNCKDGATVQEGDVLLVLDDRVAEASYNVAQKQAESDVEVRYSSKAADVAKAEYDGAVEANRKTPNTFPESKVRELRLAWERGQLSVESQQHTLEVSKLKAVEARQFLETHRITAPFSGKVRRVLKKVGEAVREEEAVLELYSSAMVRVGGDVSLAERARLAVGMPVVVEIDDLPDRPDKLDKPEKAGERTAAKREFVGWLTVIGDDVSVAGEVHVVAEVPNPDGHLLSGMTVKMRIDVAGERTASK